MTSKFSIEFENGKWLLTKDVYTVRQVTEGQVIFSSISKDAVLCLLEECQVLELAEQQAAEWEYFNNQQSEFDLYGDNAVEADYV